MSFTWLNIRDNKRRDGELIEMFCKRISLFHLSPAEQVKAHGIKYKIVEDPGISEKHKKDVLNCLMKAGIELDHIPHDKEKNSILTVAASLNNVSLDFIEYLIDNTKLNRCIQNKDGNNALLNILKSKNPNTHDIVRKLISTCGNKIVKVQDRFLNTPLHVVAGSSYQYSPEIVPMLFSFGAMDSLEKKDMHGRTPLIRAFLSQNPRKDKVIELLINRGANTDIKHEGKSPLMMAASEGNENIVRKLFEKPETANTLEYKDPFGRTALLLNAAGSKPSMELIRFLVARKGAVLNVTDQFGNNALFYAVDNGSIPLIKYILTAQRGRGIEINQKNEAGETALFKAVISESPNVLEIIQLLINDGADVNTAAKYGDSVLMNAITTKNPDIARIIKFLINADKMDIVHSNTSGRTVLHVGVVNNNKNIRKAIKEILDKVNDSSFVNKQDFLGNTAMHYALNQPDEKNRKCIVQYLMDKGGKRSINNNDGLSVKDLAKEKGLTSILERKK